MSMHAHTVVCACMPTPYHGMRMRTMACDSMHMHTVAAEHRLATQQLTQQLHKLQAERTATEVTSTHAAAASHSEVCETAHAHAHAVSGPPRDTTAEHAAAGVTAGQGTGRPASLSRKEEVLTAGDLCYASDNAYSGVATVNTGPW